MPTFREGGAVDAVTYFENRHGRKTFAFNNASQVVMGDPAYDSFAHAPRRVREHVSHKASSMGSGSTTQEERRPQRRPRGPGTDFARHVEAAGFPPDASRRSARVDVAQETLYHYEPNVLHTHRKLARMPYRAQQCDNNLQLFLRPEEAFARAVVQRQRHQQPQQGDHGDVVVRPCFVKAPKPRVITPLSAREAVCAAPEEDAHQDTTSVDYGLHHSLAEPYDRLQLLECLYAREYARLQELHLVPYEGSSVQEDIMQKDGLHTVGESKGDGRVAAPSYEELSPHFLRRRRRARSVRDVSPPPPGDIARTAAPQTVLLQRATQRWEREDSYCEEVQSSRVEDTDSASADGVAKSLPSSAGRSEVVLESDGPQSPRPRQHTAGIEEERAAYNTAYSWPPCDDLRASPPRFLRASAPQSVNVHSRRGREAQGGVSLQHVHPVIEDTVEITPPSPAGSPRRPASRFATPSKECYTCRVPKTGADAPARSAPRRRPTHAVQDHHAPHTVDMRAKQTRQQQQHESAAFIYSSNASVQPSPSPFPSRDVKTLRDICACSPLPIASGGARVAQQPPAPLRPCAAVSREAPESLRDVCRALGASS